MNKFKITLDSLMIILMIPLMKMDILGIQFHEIIGIIIFILFSIHKILNYKIIKAIGKNIFNNKLKIKSKIIFVLDIMLLCFMLTNVLTGILISKCIFNGFMTANLEFITILHKFFAWWTLILISIHIGLHLDRLVNYFIRKYKFLKNNNLLKVIILIIYFTFLILGIRSLCKYSIYSKIIPIKNNSSQIIQERKYKNNKEKRSNKNKEVANQNEKNPSLEEYLSQFNCGECRKNCSLVNPKCEIGRKKREEKVKEYYEIYGNQKDENNNLSNNETNNYNEEHNKNNKKGRNKSNVLDIINVIILFVGGTYYINELLKNKSKKV